MAQFVAGETYDITLGDERLTVKIEDASKSDMVCAKVEAISSSSADYCVGSIYEFPRNAIIS